jgi:hypothetical protein
MKNSTMSSLRVSAASVLLMMSGDASIIRQKV